MSGTKKEVMQSLIDIANDPEAFLKELVDRKINKHERVSIMAMVSYRAHQIKSSPWLIELYVCSHFEVEEMDDIRAKQFSDVIEFLVDFRGVN